MGHQWQQPKASPHRLWSSAGRQSCALPDTRGGNEEVQLQVSKGGDLERGPIRLCVFRRKL